MVSQISVHAADVKQVLRVYSVEVAAREKDDLKEDPIVVRLRKVSGLIVCRYPSVLTLIYQAGGASYDGV